MKTIFLTITLCILYVHISSAQWVQVNNGMGNVPVQALAINGNKIFVGTSANGIFISSDNGSNWVHSSLSNQDIRALVVNVNTIFAGTPVNGVYSSTDYGLSWNQTSLNNRFIRCLSVTGNNIFAGTNGIVKSSDNGTSWIQTPLTNVNIYSLASNESNIFAGRGGMGVYRSTDYGESWIQTTLNNQVVLSLAINGNTIYAGTQSQGVYLSTNNGESWTQSSFNNQTVISLSVNGYNIFAGTYSGFYVSTDNGSSWTLRNEGIGIPTINALIMTNNYIFAGSSPNGVYRRPLSEIITTIQTISNEIPNLFSLSQNYPNPFNPVTKINFNIAKTGFVSLTVFDALGREVETLVNQQMNAGSYNIDFNGSKIVSGVYFYRLQSNGFTDVKKLVLLK